MGDSDEDEEERLRRWKQHLAAQQTDDEEEGPPPAELLSMRRQPSDRLVGAVSMVMAEKRELQSEGHSQKIDWVAAMMPEMRQQIHDLQRDKEQLEARLQASEQLAARLNKAEREATFLRQSRASPASAGGSGRDAKLEASHRNLEREYDLLRRKLNAALDRASKQLDADVSGTAEQARQNFARLSDKIRTRITDALFAAARRGDVARLKRMLIGDGCDVDALDEQGGSAALAASLAGQAAFLEVLRTAGADLGRSSAVAPPHGDVAAVDAARLSPGPAPADLRVEERAPGVLYVRSCCSAAEAIGSRQNHSGHSTTSNQPRLASSESESRSAYS